MNELAKRQASVRACIRNAGIAHDNRAAGASQYAQTTAIAARQLDKSRFFRVKFNNRASFAHPARLAGITRLAGFPIDFRSKHLIFGQFVAPG